MDFLEARAAVMEAWLDGAIDDSYVTLEEVDALLLHTKLAAMDKQIEHCYESNPGLTFSGTDAELVH